MFGDADTYSSCNAVTGPFPGFPVPLVGDDVSELIGEHRDELPIRPAADDGSAEAPRASRAADAPDHTARLRENEDFMRRRADGRSTSSSARASASSSATLPPPSRCTSSPSCSGFRRRTRRCSARTAAASGATSGRQHRERRDAPLPAGVPVRTLTAYIEDRRREPRNDVMTGLARPRSRTARCPR